MSHNRKIAVIGLGYVAARQSGCEARVKLDEKVLPDARRQEGVSPTDIAHPANGAALKGARWLAVAADRVGRGSSR